MIDLSMSPAEKRTIKGLAASIEASAQEKRAGTPLGPGFSASEQYVSNTGDYAFVLPGPNDLRGPSPGLNVMANYGYIPRNGVASITQSIQGTYNDMIKLGPDL
ncbi:hypothetical protein G7Y89_g14341 [Cudoniella acicularis]|uniref:Heme haloperoxidase family profile domain-containing protein n=1 Tax=Cudoniella acicularis TaxID=354080 RepID=A0A8H4R5R5_9HELO|nr:hypothetical protein G7Y89_g14341 [Cudoniella acicularis]